MTEAVTICSANQWTGFYMITASVMKELKMSNISKLPRLAKFIYEVTEADLGLLQHPRWNAL